MKWTCCLLLLLPFASVIRADDGIHKDAVSSVINMLASDAMEGRKAGTPGAHKAAAFIAKSFDEAGLKPMADMDGFRHKFTMQEVTPGEASLVLDGQNVDAETFAFREGGASVKLDSVEGVNVVHIGSEANPRANFGQLLNSEKPTIVLMDSAHSAFFARVRSFIMRPNMQAGKAEKSVKIFVKTDKKEVTSLAFKATNKMRELDLANVVGVVPGKNPDAIVMFSAHYDHLGRIQAVDGDDIANGADDDASGVTGLIMLARHFGAGPKPERTLVFVAFTGEEMGTLGSRAFRTYWRLRRSSPVSIWR